MTTLRMGSSGRGRCRELNRVVPGVLWLPGARILGSELPGPSVADQSAKLVPDPSMMMWTTALSRLSGGA
jgi:hypothetical protein